MGAACRALRVSTRALCRPSARARLLRLLPPRRAARALAARIRRRIRRCEHHPPAQHAHKLSSVRAVMHIIARAAGNASTCESSCAPGTTTCPNALERARWRTRSPRKRALLAAALRAATCAWERWMQNECTEACRGSYLDPTTSPLPQASQQEWVHRRSTRCAHDGEGRVRADGAVLAHCSGGAGARSAGGSYAEATRKLRGSYLRALVGGRYRAPGSGEVVLGQVGHARRSGDGPDGWFRRHDLRFHESYTRLG